MEYPFGRDCEDKIDGKQDSPYELHHNFGGYMLIGDEIEETFEVERSSAQQISWTPTATMHRRPAAIPNPVPEQRSGVARGSTCGHG